MLTKPTVPYDFCIADPISRRVNARSASCLNSVLNVIALVGAFNQEKAQVGAFSVIVEPIVEPMEHYTALVAENSVGYKIMLMLTPGYPAMSTMTPLVNNPYSVQQPSPDSQSFANMNLASPQHKPGQSELSQNHHG